MRPRPLKQTLPEVKPPLIRYKEAEARPMPSGKLPDVEALFFGGLDKGFVSLLQGKTVKIEGKPWKETAVIVRENAAVTLAESLSVGTWASFYESNQLYTPELVAWRLEREKLMSEGIQAALAKAREFAENLLIGSDATFKRHKDKPRRWRTQQTRK